MAITVSNSPYIVYVVSTSKVTWLRIEIFDVQHVLSAACKQLEDSLGRRRWYVTFVSSSISIHCAPGTGWHSSESSLR